MVLQVSLEYVVTKLYVSHRWGFDVQIVGASAGITLQRGSMSVVQ